METTILNQENEVHLLKLRNLRLEDYEAITQINEEIYGSKGVWSYKSIEKLLQIFSEGQICIEDKGKVVAYALAIRVPSEKVEEAHTYQEITGNYTFSTHNPSGEILYGIEISVSKSYRGMRLGRRLYDARKEICETLNLKSIIAGGRMPNYSQYKDKISPRTYIDKVRSREILDPVLTFQIANDFHVKRILKNYLPLDKASGAYATLIEWNNVYYEKKPALVGGKKSYCRIGVVQWQMRNVNSLDSFFENVEFFVDAVSGYKADFVLFPELFNAPLMAEFNELPAPKAIRELAEYTEEIRQKLVKFALEYNINIIAGSMPLYENQKLYNVSYLCHRNGTWDVQYKIHPTPSESQEWGMKGGVELKVFDTDVAKVGILICYDVEFPELSRILAEQELQILFVPFSTDMLNGYQRVRICAQARAIENECYVAIAGSVGNLPKVINMDVQYAQSAIFSPSDFAFPQNAIIAEGTPNNEMTIVADVDLDLLKELNLHGSVRNLRDRRKDLYQLKWLK